MIFSVKIEGDIKGTLLNFKIANDINKNRWKKTSSDLYLIFKSSPDRIRTCDPLLRRQMLYPAELRDHYFNKKFK
jgi:hypothetical protein